MTDGLPFIDSLWDYNDPAKTEQTFNKLLPGAENSGDTDYYAQLLTQIARTHSLRQQFDRAHEILDKVGDILADHKEIPEAWVRYYLERGRTFNSAGEKDKALVLFKQAYDLADQHNLDFYAIDALHMLAIAAPHNEALEWSEKAIQRIENSSDERSKKWAGALYNNTGWTYHDKGEYERAMEYFEKCLEWHSERKTGQGERIARWTVARCLRSLGKSDAALNKQMDLLKEIEENNLEQDGYVYEEIAECNYEIGNKNEAAPYFAKAYELLSNDGWLKQNETQRLERLKELGKK
jgi:tetratricopeptide (TPR) repeat protein